MRGLFLIAALSFALPRCEDTERIATLNLENYPKHPQQGPAAFAMIRDLDVSAVALQEITRPQQLAAEAREQLGPSWSFVWADTGGFQRVGFLYDTDEMTVLSTQAHSETLLHRQAKPALEVVVQPRGADEPLHVFVVHLKATSKSEDIRAQQLAALAPILKARRDAGKRVVFMGDFNSTNDGDRQRISELSATLGMDWASEGLPCTNYWSRKDRCIGHPLDHVLSWEAPESIEVGGGCATDGCDPGDTCPIYHSQISDHCPVVVELNVH